MNDQTLEIKELMQASKHLNDTKDEVDIEIGSLRSKLIQIQKKVGNEFISR